MKSKKVVFFTAVIFSVFLLLPAISAAIQEEGIQALSEDETNYPTTSVDYRPIVAANFDSSDASDEIVVDFGSNGLKLYNSGTWYDLTGANPDWILAVQFAAADYELLADFGAGTGLWWWNHTDYTGTWIGAWTKISDHDADYAFAVDDDNDGKDELHIDFGSLGLWRFDYDTLQWNKLSPSNPSFGLRGDYVGTVGHEEGIHAFGGLGTWEIYWSALGPYYSKINNQSPDVDCVSADFDTGDGGLEVIMDYSGMGTWMYDDGSWNKMNNAGIYDIIPARLVGSSDYEAIATFNGVNGLWMWNLSGYPGSFTKINNNNPTSDGAFCEAFDPLGGDSGDEEVACDFGGLGLWLWDYSAGSTWTKINNNSPQSMVRADYYGDGRKSTLLCDFGALGLWLYDGPFDWWGQISPLNPGG